MVRAGRVPAGVDATAAAAGDAPMGQDRVGGATTPVETGADVMGSATNPVETMDLKLLESTYAVPKVVLHQRATVPTVVSALSVSPARKAP